jgi:hypothetical protein
VGGGGRPARTFASTATLEEAMTVFLDEVAVPFEEGEHSDRLVLVGE